MKLIPAGMSRGIGHQMLVAKKNSPHIFFGAGVIGVITSAVLACRATLKLEDTIDEIRKEVDEVKNDNHLRTGTEYELTQREEHQALGRVYIRSAVKIGKLYGPSVVLGAASVGCLTGAHVQQSRRNSALTATVGLISQAFEEYRERVREEIGEERESDVYNGIRTEKRVIDGKKVDVKVLDANGRSPYARTFNQWCPSWKRDAYYNRMFVESQQAWANEKLRVRGHMLLNDVYDALGMERSQAGTIVGWLYDKDGNTEGDNYIDFGIFMQEDNFEFINGSEFDVHLDFNVDGIINDKI